MIYVSGFFRNQNPTGISATLRDFVPFAYMNDALKAVFGLTTGAVPFEVFVYPSIIAAVLTFGVSYGSPTPLAPVLAGGRFSSPGPPS